MEEERGIVISTEGVTAKVAVESKSACEGCAVGGACTTTDQGAEIEALNAVRAKKGQTVRIVMKPYTYLKGTILVYGMPLMLFLVGSIGGKIIASKYYEFANSDIIAAICGFSMLILSVIIIKIWSRNIDKKVSFQPVIEEIIS